MISSASLGVSRATELLLFPEPFSAETALQWGLVHRVVESGQALAGAQALASRLAQGPTAAYRAVKTILASAATDSLEQTLALEARLQAALGQTEDHREAVEAFNAKTQAIVRRSRVRCLPLSAAARRNMSTRSRPSWRAATASLADPILVEYITEWSVSKDIRERK
jgi:hypothetical protein